MAETNMARVTANFRQYLKGRGEAVAFGSLPVMIRPLDRAADLGEPPTGGLRIETVEEPGRLTELVRTYSASMGVAPGLEGDVVRIEAQRADKRGDT